MNITVTTFGTTPDKFEKIVETQFINIEEGLKVLGVETRDQMRQIISSSKHRPLGSDNNLENTIDVHFEAGNVVGIGKVSDLNVRAPYWYIVNYGGWAAPPGTKVLGHFGQQSQPNPAFAGTGVGRESFTLDSFPTYLMTIRNPIWAMNYIEKTKSWLQTKIRVHQSGWTRKTKVA